MKFALGLITLISFSTPARAYIDDADAKISWASDLLKQANDLHVKARSIDMAPSCKVSEDAQQKCGNIALNFYNQADAKMAELRKYAPNYPEVENDDLNLKRAPTMKDPAHPTADDQFQKLIYINAFNRWDNKNLDAKKSYALYSATHDQFKIVNQTEYLLDRDSKIADDKDPIVAKAVKGGDLAHSAFTAKTVSNTSSQQSLEAEVKKLSPSWKSDAKPLGSMDGLTDDELMARMITDRAGWLNAKDLLTTCVKCDDIKNAENEVYATYLTDFEAASKRLHDHQKPTASSTAKTESKVPAKLADLKGQILTLPKGRNFGLTSKGDLDFTGYKISDSCTTTVKYTSFQNYADLYTGESNADQSWTIGKYIPSYAIDNKQQGAQEMCKQLDGQKVQAECLNTLRQLKPYQVPDSVVLTATDESSRMTVYSSDHSKQDQGVLECLKAQNLNGLDGSEGQQVAKSATAISR